MSFTKSADWSVNEIPECEYCEKPAIAWVKLFDDDGENDAFWEAEFCGLHLLHAFHDHKHSRTDVVEYCRIVKRA